MPCAEFTNAIAWNKKSTGKEEFPVKAYFTKHFGGGATSVTVKAKDAVHYASGKVVAVDTPTPHLKGTLKATKNTEQDGEMVETSETYDVEIFPDGTLSYLRKIKGKPVGGMPATKVQPTCVNNMLLTATTEFEVVTVGVARKPFFLAACDASMFVCSALYQLLRGLLVPRLLLVTENLALRQQLLDWSTKLTD